MLDTCNLPVSSELPLRTLFLCHNFICFPPFQRSFSKIVSIRRHAPLTSEADNRLRRSIQLLLARRLESQLAGKLRTYIAIPFRCILELFQLIEVMKMKLDHDCVRAILIWVESNVPVGNPRYTDELIDDLKSKWTEAEIIYCVAQLGEANLLDGGAVIQGGAIVINQVNKLTWKGHEYLDNIRDDGIWKETKATVFSKVGNASLSIISSLAAKLIETKLGL
ncbi:hypothetical protein DIS16_09895 [Levilactobacillus brevis]|nr:hypothetical protein DIS16_09895 [Levilactobacillus brevis]